MSSETKSAVAALVLFTIFGGGYAFVLIDNTISDFKQIERQEAACTRLNPKYGQKYRVLKGPYSNIKFVAVHFNNTSIGLKPVSNIDSEIRWFRCEELTEVLGE
jgi:hypothetical protein